MGFFYTSIYEEGEYSLVKIKYGICWSFIEWNMKSLSNFMGIFDMLEREVIVV